MTRNSSASDEMIDDLDPSIVTSHVLLTPQMAQEYLDHNHPLNRDVTMSKVKTLAQNIKMGRFLFTGDSIKFDDQGRMIDGSHRCMAVVEAGVPVWTAVVTGLDPDVINLLDQNNPRDVSDLLKMSGRSMTFLNESIAIKSLLIQGTPEMRPFIGNRPKIADLVWEDRTSLEYWASWASRLYSASDLYINPKHPWANRKSNKRAVSKTVLATLAYIMSTNGADDAEGGLIDQFFEAITTGVASDARTRNFASIVRRYLVTTNPLIRVGGGNQSFGVFRNFDTIIRVYNRWVLGDTINRVQPKRDVDDITEISEITRPERVVANFPLGKAANQ